MAGEEDKTNQQEQGKGQKQEQKQKRILYQEQRKDMVRIEPPGEYVKKLKIQIPLNQESLINKNGGRRGGKPDEEEEKRKKEQRKKEAEERLKKSQELLDKNKSEGGGKKKAIKDAISAVKEQGSEEVFQQASGFIQNILWGSVLAPTFLLAVAGLDVYAMLLSGLIDGIVPGLSTRLAPLGILTKSLPMGLGKFLGRIALVFLNVVLIILFLIIIVFIYYLVNPAELIKLLPEWETVSKLFGS